MHECIKTFETEHEHILANLDALEKNVDEVKRKKGFAEVKKNLVELKKISAVFEEAEKHHSREEDVLFPALEKQGVFGPPQMMRMEHEQLREVKKRIRELASKPGKDYAKFVAELEENSTVLLDILRAHIDKENTILYPMAEEAIPASEWTGMEKRMDKIGYCCFHPGCKHHE